MARDQRHFRAGRLEGKVVGSEITLNPKWPRGGIMIDDPAMSIAARTVDLTKIYGKGDTEVRALDGVSVEIRTGEFTAVMGPSGSGKSTLVHCMAALDTPSSGSVSSVTPTWRASMTRR